MPVFITQSDYARTVGINLASTSKRFSGLPHSKSAPRLYNLADVLPTLRARERGLAAALFDAATVRQHLFVGDTVLPTALRLLEWLTPVQQARLRHLQTEFAAGLAAKFMSADLWAFYERLRLAILLHHDVLRFVVVGDVPLPDMARLSPAFCLTNARFEPMPVYEKEAA